MGYAITHRRAVRAEAAARAGRHAAAWEEARAADAAWRHAMMTPAVAAAHLGISKRTLDRYVAAGRIQRVKLGDTRQAPARFRRVDVEAFKASLLGAGQDKPQTLT